jgi:hypothetical protein
VAQAAQVNPVPPALAACFRASLAFMLPVSTPPNAIVFGTRRLESLRYEACAPSWFVGTGCGLSSGRSYPAERTGLRRQLLFE